MTLVPTGLFPLSLQPDAYPFPPWSLGWFSSLYSFRSPGVPSLRPSLQTSFQPSAALLAQSGG